MSPEEQTLLAELRRREVWERWGEFLPVQAFDSEDARDIRGAIDSLHRGNTKAVLPNTWITSARRVSHEQVKLDAPLPLSTSLEKVEDTVIVRGVTSHLDQLEQLIGHRRQQGERMTAADTHGACQWLESVSVQGNGQGNGHCSLLSAKELINGREWENKETFPTYLHAGLDEYLGGGIGRGELGVIQSPAKRGKTSFLLTLSYRAALDGKRVLYISCENYRGQIGERLSQIHGVGRSERLPDFYFGYHYLVRIADIHHYVEEAMPLDLLVVDYEGKMGSSAGDDWTWRTQELYTGLRDGTAGKYDLACWTATQEHEPTDWQRSSTRTGTFGSKTKIQLCDLFLGAFVRPKMNSVTWTVLGRRGQGREGGEFRSYFNPDTAELRDL